MRDDDAFARLFASEQASVLRLAYVLTGDGELAQDVIGSGEQRAICARGEVATDSCLSFVGCQPNALARVYTA